MTSRAISPAHFGQFGKDTASVIRSVDGFGLSRAHADALDGLEQLAFGFDARRDDDFSLLEFANAGRADVAHASGDCPDEVLRAIINRSGSEKDLFQAASDAHFDPGAAGQVGVRSSHSPMIAAAGRFLSPGESAPNHDRIAAAGQRFANVAAFA